MASYKNLGRIAEIARDLPKMEEARKMLAENDTQIEVYQEKTDSMVILPSQLKYNIINAINLEINKQKEELKGL
jgi:hypothetical protein